VPLGYVPGSHRGLYSRLSHRVFGSRKFTRTIEYRILERWLPTRPCRALDVGGGGGELAVQLVLKHYRVTLLDLDFSALQHSRSPYASSLALTVGDAGHLPFRDGTFDLVVCNSALEHFPQDEEAIREMARVLRRNGTLLLTTDTFPPRVSTWLRLLPRSWRTPGLEAEGDFTSRLQSLHQRVHKVVNYYRPESLIRKLETHGYVVREWRYYMNGPVSRAIFELHLLLKWLDFHNATSRRLFPLFYPFTLVTRSPTQAAGYGLAVKAVKESK
jgi:ubiquinone/menaquinone biosynthesis C-methylase UbiE